MSGLQYILPLYYIPLYQYISNYSPLNFFFKIIKSKTTKNKGFIEVQMTDKMIFKNLNGI